jgi:nucleoside-diphosphate-sugar epimerase
MDYRVLVTGAGGYVGARLVPELLKQGYSVVAVDTFWYGDNVMPTLEGGRLKIAKLDIRNQHLLEEALEDVDAVIHLACISNDPSFDLNPELGKSINLDAFEPLVKIAKSRGVHKFVYASSSSVYGVKNELKVTENLSLEPLTDYSKYKAACEEILFENSSPSFVTTVLRPATVCGWSPRQRFDLSVNILTNHAVNNRRIRVFGGGQHRPNIHIDDMVSAYLLVLNAPDKLIDLEVFNVGSDNLTINEIAEQVSKLAEVTEIVHEPTDDLRSYRVDSEKIINKLGFQFKRKVSDAITDLLEAFKKEKFVDSLNNPLYFNIKRMQQLKIQ